MDDTGASTTGWGTAPSNAPNAMKHSKYTALFLRESLNLESHTFGGGLLLHYQFNEVQDLASLVNG